MTDNYSHRPPHDGSAYDICGRCRATVARKKREAMGVKKRKPSQTGGAGPDFPGWGVLDCMVCGESLLGHSMMEICDDWREDRT